VAYNRYPPVGGPHDGTWANCNGIVYATAVRTENMVHTLEHGAVWITYNPDTISQADLATLTALVQDQPFTTLSPYPGLDSNISLQAWAHQLKVDSASDERVKQFITALRQNRWVYPETGATCQQPSFDTQNPPAFDPTPPGANAIPMSGTGGVVNSTEMSVASSDESVDATASVPVTTADQSPAEATSQPAAGVGVRQPASSRPATAFQSRSPSAFRSASRLSSRSVMRSPPTGRRHGRGRRRG